MKRRIAFVGAFALVFSMFTAPAASAADCSELVSGTWTIEEAGAYALTLQMDQGDLVIDHDGGVCGTQSVDISAEDIDMVAIEQSATVTFLLDDVSTEEVGDWEGLEFDVVVTDGGVVFDASDVDDSVGVDVEVGSGGDFVFERGDGELDVDDDVEFRGSSEDDRFDARTYDGDVVADGDYGDDVLYGGDGNDALLCSGSGYDECWGGDGDDDLTIGRGDTAAPGDGDDDVEAYATSGDWTLTYADASHGITYDKEGYGDVRSPGGDDRISGDDPLTVIGSSYGDEIIGDDHSETLEGGGGDDLVRGHRGDDRISGDAGDDSLYGGRDDDTISGGDGSDDLFGRRGRDDLRGDAGVDRLDGGWDRDSCSGEYQHDCEW